MRHIVMWGLSCFNFHVISGIPVFLAVTQMDTIEENMRAKQALENKIELMIPLLKMVGNENRVSRLTLYCNQVYAKSTKRSIGCQRIRKLDDPLCALWEQIVNPGFIISRTYTPVPKPPPRPRTPPPQKSCTLL